MQINLSDSRDRAATPQHRHRCHCGTVIAAKRAGRRAKFCSDRCRDEARRARNFVSLGRTRGEPRNAENFHARSNGYSERFRDRAPVDPGLWRRIVEIELFADRTWREVVSADVVACRVALVGLSAATRADAAALIAAIPADLSIPNFLRRSPRPNFANEQVTEAVS